MLVLDALDEATAWDRPPPAPHRVLCLMAARTVAGLAAGYARYDARRRRTQLTIWQRSAPAAGTVRVEQEEAAEVVADWWTRSRGRRVLLDALGQRYLAELPLVTDPPTPTLLVVGRQLPLTDADADRLAAARRALCAVEAVIERLRAGAEPTAVAAGVAAGGAAGVAAGVPPGLTGREVEVLQMLAEGLLARSIAQRLDVSERTVHKHLGNLYRKLDAHDRLLAVRRAESLGLVPAGAGRG